MTTRDRKESYKSVVWSVDDPRKGPIDCYVKVVDQQTVAVMFRDSDTTTFTGFILRRRYARLLARRINQCLDDTQ